jgi:hypothetical protein
MNKVILVVLLVVLSIASITACQQPPPASKAPAPVPAAPPAAAPATSTTAPAQVPPAPPTAPSAQPVPQAPLKITVEIEGARNFIPIGQMFNIKYSTNRSANLTMSSSLPDGQTIEFFTLEIGKPDTYIYQVKDDRPIGDRTITIKAVGIDGQTATASCKYWAGSVPGNKEIP